MRYHFPCRGYTHSTIVRNDRDKEKRFKKWGQKRIEIKASSLSDIILTQKKQHEA